jgi:hypothetical protein
MRDIATTASGFHGDRIMTRTSILAVSVFAALSSSCLISTGALAFGHGFGGHAFAPPAFAPHPVVPHQMAPSFSAKRPSFTANHFSKGQTHQTNLANASHLHSGSSSHHTTKDTGTTSAQPASGCGIVCKQPGPVQPVDPTKGGKNPNGGGTTATGTGGSATATGGNSTVNVDTGGSGGGAGDVIGQVASVISGIAQAQAAPAQQVAAPAQQVAAPVVTHAPLQRFVAETVGFRAIALGWNNNGAWVVRTSPTLASAGADAVQTCNSQFGACTLSEAQVAPTSFGCLVVVESDDASRVFAAAGNSSETALTAAAAQITNAGLHGQIVYTGCNS